MKPMDEWVTIKENIFLTPRLLKISFDFPRLAKAACPGQFLQMAIEDTRDPFLRRPFTIYRVMRNTIEILYEVVGKGSRLLSDKKKGERLKVMGPLGNTFTLDLKKRIHVAVGGGVGIAPFIFLGQRIPVHYFLMGARSKEGLLPSSEFRALSGKKIFATEDGSHGIKGFVTAGLEKVIHEVGDAKKLYLFVCGPKKMLEAVMEMAERFGIEGEASMDERMACGIGACLGCMVKTRDGYKTSCKDGTVFNFKDLLVD